MSPVDFKKWQCPLSLILKCPCRFKGSSVSPVDFKKWPCHPVEFKGQGPHTFHSKDSSCPVILPSRRLIAGGGASTRPSGVGGNSRGVPSVYQPAAATAKCLLSIQVSRPLVRLRDLAGLASNSFELCFLLVDGL